MCVGVPFQCGYGGVVSLCSLKHYSGSYFKSLSGSVCVGVPFQCGYGGVVSLCSLKHFHGLSGETNTRNTSDPVNLILLKP